MSSDRSHDPSMKQQLKGRRRPLETGIVVSLFVMGAISIAITLGILWELGK